jgi:hypothetical protein
MQKEMKFSERKGQKGGKDRKERQKWTVEERIRVKSVWKRGQIINRSA